MTIIFEDRGKQYKVSVGDYVKLPRLKDLKKNDKVSFNKIIFYKDEKGQSYIGSPNIEGMYLEAKVIDQIRDKKIIVFKKKRRQNYRRKIGHRQDLTLVKIEMARNNKNKSPKESSSKESSENKSVSKGESNGS